MDRFQAYQFENKKVLEAMQNRLKVVEDQDPQLRKSPMLQPVRQQSPSNIQVDKVCNKD